jgi:hypothetical protein
MADLLELQVNNMHQNTGHLANGEKLEGLTFMHFQGLTYTGAKAKSSGLMTESKNALMDTLDNVSGGAIDGKNIFYDSATFVGPTATSISLNQWLSTNFPNLVTTPTGLTGTTANDLSRQVGFFPWPNGDLGAVVVTPSEKGSGGAVVNKNTKVSMAWSVTEIDHELRDWIAAIQLLLFPARKVVNCLGNVEVCLVNPDPVLVVNCPDPG